MKATPNKRKEGGFRPKEMDSHSQLPRIKYYLGTLPRSSRGNNPWNRSSFSLYAHVYARSSSGSEGHRHM